MNLTEMDIVYVVKNQEDNEELRHSLRSVEANFPHRNIVIVGFKPSWVTNVKHIRVMQTAGSKYRNIEQNFYFAVRDEDISKDFVLFNDDFFCLEPISSLPPSHRGTIKSQVKAIRKRNGAADYAKRLEDTEKYLEELGFENIKSYELHSPMVMNRKNRLKARELCLRDGQEELEMRSIYGNIFNIGGQEVEDNKVYSKDEEPDLSQAFISTTDESFTGIVGDRIKEVFPIKCRYEL
jgi:hypothetical protein